jgi:hypothetical protein
MRRAALMVVVGLALVGCGVGPGAKTTGSRPVSLTITRDFGTHTVGTAHTSSIPSGETAMRFLERGFDVKTRYGGGFVQSIEGLTGTASGGRRVDWFYYVNGIEASQGAASRKVHAGDRIWWDRHDWSAAMRIPAVVGSFPEPFTSGANGERLPVRIDCATPSQKQCDEVARRLVAAGVKAAPMSALGTTAGVEILRVVVGTWKEIRRDPTVSLIDKGPKNSGVFAIPHADGIDLLGPDGKVTRTIHSGGGLVAATRFEEQQPTWVVTGVDEAGVAAASAAFDEGILKNRFAVAVEDGRGVPLPVQDTP